MFEWYVKKKYTGKIYIFVLPAPSAPTTEKKVQCHVFKR